MDDIQIQILPGATKLRLTYLIKWKWVLKSFCKNIYKKYIIIKKKNRYNYTVWEVVGFSLRYNRKLDLWIKKKMISRFHNFHQVRATYIFFCSIISGYCLWQKYYSQVCSKALNWCTFSWRIKLRCSCRLAKNQVSTN